MPVEAPRTATSRSASANTMFGDLPPSSSVSFLSGSAESFIRCLPTSVEPVKLILSTPGCLTIASPTMAPLPGNTFSTPGKPGLERQLADADRGERGDLRRLQDHTVPGRERRGRLPAHHDHREVPGDDRAHHAERLAQGEGEERRAHRQGLAGELG